MNTPRQKSLVRASVPSLVLSALALTLAPAAAAEPLKPDIFPWANQFPNYMYGGIFDTGSIKNKVLYRFHNALPNIGAGPLELREVTHPDKTQDVYQRIYQTSGDPTETLIGSFPNASGPYGHLYLPGIAQYNFRSVLPGDGVGPILTTNYKTSYALVDSTDYDTSLPNAPQTRHYNSVNGVDGIYLGISVGWADVYDRSTKGQWADATLLPSGEYWLEVIADPFNRIQESNEDNNTTQIKLNLVIPQPQIYPGDYNNDGHVTAADYTVWRNTIGATVTPGTGADGDGDGKITSADYPVWQARYGESASAAGTLNVEVPEPTTLYLAALGCAALVARNRRAKPH